MHLIPELKKVLIYVPRTGSGSLYRAVAAKYPKAMLLYRHMEADGVPAGYDRWEKIGVVREPIARLWSLYKFCRTYTWTDHPEHTAGVRASVERPFEDWLLNNERVFCTQFDQVQWTDYYANLTCRHALPENRKSQFFYLRPDLGTRIYHYLDVASLWKELGLEPTERVNTSPPSYPPLLSREAVDYIKTVFAWDLRASAS